MSFRILSTHTQNFRWKYWKSLKLLIFHSFQCLNTNNFEVNEYFWVKFRVYTRFTISNNWLCQILCVLHFSRIWRLDQARMTLLTSKSKLLGWITRTIFNIFRCNSVFMFSLPYQKRHSDSFLISCFSSDIFKTIGEVQIFFSRLWQFTYVEFIEIGYHTYRIERKDLLRNTVHQNVWLNRVTGNELNRAVLHWSY